MSFSIQGTQPNIVRRGSFDGVPSHQVSQDQGLKKVASFPDLSKESAGSVSFLNVDATLRERALSQTSSAGSRESMGSQGGGSVEPSLRQSSDNVSQRRGSTDIPHRESLLNESSDDELVDAQSDILFMPGAGMLDEESQSERYEQVGSRGGSFDAMGLSSEDVAERETARLNAGLKPSSDDTFSDDGDAVEMHRSPVNKSASNEDKLSPVPVFLKSSMKPKNRDSLDSNRSDWSETYRFLSPATRGLYKSTKQGGAISGSRYLSQLPDTLVVSDLFEDSRLKLNSARAYMTDMEDSLKKNELLIKDQEFALLTLNLKVQGNEAKIAQLEGELEDLQYQVLVEKRSLDEARGSVAAARKEHAGLKKVIQALAVERNRVQEALQAEISKRGEADVVTVADAVAQTKRLLEMEYAQRFESLLSEQTVHHLDKARLEREIAEKDKRIEAGDELLKERDAHISRDAATATQQSDRILDLTRENATLKRTVSEFKAELYRMNQGISGLTGAPVSKHEAPVERESEITVNQSVAVALFGREDESRRFVGNEVEGTSFEAKPKIKTIKQKEKDDRSVRRSSHGSSNAGRSEPPRDDVTGGVSSALTSNVKSKKPDLKSKTKAGVKSMLEEI